MRPWTWYVPLLAISLVFFVMAALADNYAFGFFLAVCGALVPALGAATLILVNIMRWQRMGRELGLVKEGPGAYGDLRGVYEGRRLVILRRIDPYARGNRDSTVLRLQGHGEVRLPGTVSNADVVRSVLGPLLHQNTSEPVET